MQNQNDFDKNVLEIIKKIQSGEGTDEQLALWVENELKEFPNILDFIFYSKKSYTAEEIFEIYKKDHKIYL
ncbi:MAG: hypothetical protein ACRC4G_02015 [Alphaproteobacteria bacterium]